MAQEILEFVLEFLSNMHIRCRRIHPPFRSLIDYDLGLRKSILKITEEREVGIDAGKLEPNTIFYLTDRFFCHYGIMELPQEENYLLIGPFLVEQMTTEQILDVMERNNISEDFFWQMDQYYRESITPTSINGIFALINQLGEKLYGKEKLSIRYLDAEQMEVWEEYFSNYEMQIPTTPALSMKVLEERYEYEEKLLEAVHRGNTAQALGLVTDSFSMKKRLTDGLRDSKNLLITLNTLLRKEVERACVHPWHIDCFSNSNIVKIEQIETMEQVSDLYRKLVKGYCEMVQKHSLQGYSLLTRKIINVIDADLTQDLSLKAFAKQLNVNASYLSGLFKSDTGSALTDYVNKRRMYQARKLLLTTSLTIQDIAIRVGVPDVRYFNRMFKRDSEVSPSQYRKKKRETGADSDIRGTNGLL